MGYVGYFISVLLISFVSTLSVNIIASDHGWPRRTKWALLVGMWLALNIVEPIFLFPLFVRSS